MFCLFLSFPAQQDAERAINYYHQISLTVAMKFIEELDVLYKHLKEAPQHFSFIDGKNKLRSAAFQKFPYSIIFEVKENAVYIFSVFDTRQDPAKLSNKI